MEQSAIDILKQKGFVNTENPYEVRERTRAKILKLLSDNRDREWSVTEVANEIDANLETLGQVKQNSRCVFGFGVKI
ncbi:MAG: hypothetical protein OEX10_01775 [Candidatus Bathyarchaeota archaeon]|nr:hypothetical protein [Candidatus Bathyarchaeota archaeon]MDH5662942.1 hypothetical protein [Candidatus Bathyarchaeota archaeon]